MGPFVRERYQVLATAGRGGQGTVLRALDVVHQRHVAIKVRGVRSEHEREAVLEEARILLTVRPHPNLPLLREDFTEGDRYYLVMDWIEGRDLAQVLHEEGGPGLPFDRVLDHLSQAAEALDHLHDHDPPVVHQDVKPANLVLTADGRVILVDFGIARNREGPGTAPRGTHDYVPPEVASGDSPTSASDIFSLAVTAYALLTGAPPRPEVRPNLGDRPSEGVIRALRRGLAIDPARRPPSAAAFVEALRAGARGASSASRKRDGQLRPGGASMAEYAHRGRVTVRDGLALLTATRLLAGVAGVLAVFTLVSGLPDALCLAAVPDRTAYASYRNGSVVMQQNHDEVYVVAGGALFWAHNLPEFHEMGRREAEIQTVPDGDLDRYVDVVVAPRDGTAIQDFRSPAVYMVFGGTAFLVTDSSSPHGMRDAKVITLPPGGADRVLRNPPREGTLYREQGATQTFVVRHGHLQPGTACASGSVLTVPHSSLKWRFPEIGQP
jgi:predicted Ser/Thr protein kinase